MIPVEGTSYAVSAIPVFASNRWRFEIVEVRPSGRAVVVTASAATYRTAAIAEEVGANTARAMTKKTLDKPEASGVE